MEADLDDVDRDDEDADDADGDPPPRTPLTGNPRPAGAPRMSSPAGDSLETTR